MSKICVVKVVTVTWFLFTSKFLWHTFKLLKLKIAKTDMRNIKYTLLQIFVKKIFVKNSGNICKKKMIWKASNSKTTWDTKTLKNNGYRTVVLWNFINRWLRPFLYCLSCCDTRRIPFIAFISVYLRCM